MCEPADLARVGDPIWLARAGKEFLAEPGDIVGQSKLSVAYQTAKPFQAKLTQ